MNKLNKLVENTFDKKFTENWFSEDFQKKIKKLLKKEREKEREKYEESSDRTVLGKDKKYTPYIKFCMAERNAIKEAHPEESAKKVTALLGEAWNNYKENNPDYLKENYGFVKKN